MSFTTGLKQVVVNNADEISYDTTADELYVKGVGKFKTSETRKCFLAAPLASVPGQYDCDMTGATLGFVSGDLMTVAIMESTYRSQGELSSPYSITNDPLVLQFQSTGATTITLATNIVAAITAMSVEDKARYKIASASLVSTDSVRIVMTDWSISVNKMEVNGASGFPVINVEATISTVPLEGRGLAKYVEESIKLSTKASRDAYGVDNTTQVDMNATYMQLFIEKGYETLDVGSESVINAGPKDRIARTQIWLNRTNFTDAVLASSGIIHATTATTVDYYLGDLNAIAAFKASEDVFAETETLSYFQDVI